LVLGQRFGIQLFQSPTFFVHGRHHGCCFLNFNLDNGWRAWQPLGFRTWGLASSLSKSESASDRLKACRHTLIAARWQLQTGLHDTK
jgi:hypothetical protein